MTANQGGRGEKLRPWRLRINTGDLLKGRKCAPAEREREKEREVLELQKSFWVEKPGLDAASGKFLSLVFSDCVFDKKQYQFL